MGKEKGGFLTPKAISNRIKSKGLQKLRWYCQMCQKQCRDENGFNCHTTSESHQRQLLLFAENPDEYIDTFSKDFEDDYIELMRRRFGTKRVQCNLVYQEYISMREHTHMNATHWETLTDFVKHLGREGKCEVDETEKGWFVKYIDRDSETLKKQRSMRSKEIMDMDDNERAALQIQEQIKRGAKAEKNVKEAEFTELQRDNVDDKVTLSLSLGGSTKVKLVTAGPRASIFDKGSADRYKEKEAEKNKKERDRYEENGSDNESSRRRADERLHGEDKDEQIDRHDRKKDKHRDREREKHRDRDSSSRKRKHEDDRSDSHASSSKYSSSTNGSSRSSHKALWVRQNIRVRVVDERYKKGRFYNSKVTIVDVFDADHCVCKTDDGKVLEDISQSMLETVVPKSDSSYVCIVEGKHRGKIAYVLERDKKKQCATLQLLENRDKVLQLDYDAICEYVGDINEEFDF